jgi:dTDP-4-amino-4,6-dideoxygalactose transaminase
MYGLPADMEGVRRAIGERPIAIVEDSAQAIGARYGDRSAGSLGTMGCFSFYATKNITTGEGGAITTDDDDLAARLRTLRNQGQGARYDYEEPGFNARMTELQAAVGVAQMGRFDRIVEARRNNAAALTEGLRGIEGLTLPAEPPGRFHVYHHYAARVGLDARLTREKVVDALGEAGVEAGTHYPRAVYDYACFRADPRVGKVRLPQAETLAAEVVSLPVHPSLSEDDLAWIVRSVQAILA